ncbi:MAG: DUF3793 family protein [Treponema sp.]|nr:DUF3793 family protein [Treponema sp.]
MQSEIEKIIINQCSPVLFGCKPSALFMIQSEHYLSYLSALLPADIGFTVLRKHKNRLLVLAFDKISLEKTILNEVILKSLTGLGYPAGICCRDSGSGQRLLSGTASVFILLDYLKKRFELKDFPHEVGFFLGYPAEDVLGFVKHRGENYKLCGYWKVYGNVNRAKKCFSQYDLCRESMKTIFAEKPVQIPVETRFVFPFRAEAKYRSA